MKFCYNLHGEIMKENILIKIKDDISTALGKRQKQFVTGNRVEILAVTKNHPPELISLWLDLTT